MDAAQHDAIDADVFPEVGRRGDEILATLVELHKGDIDWRGGKGRQFR